MIVIRHKRECMYAKQYISLSFPCASLHHIVRGALCIVKDIHIMNEADVIAILFKYFSFINTSVYQVVKFHTFILAHLRHGVS